MILQLMSLNLQGVNGALAPQKVKNYCSLHFRHLDILCFQEHKLRGTKFQHFGNKIWRQATFLGCEAEEGYNHLDGVEGAGKGGICTFISPRLSPFLHSHGSIGTNLAQWCHFSNLPGGDIAFLNVYAPYSDIYMRTHY